MGTLAECVNCHEEVLGNYCQNCGQKLNVAKLTWRSLLNDLQQRMFGFDSRVWNTVKDMTIRPERVVNAFRSGVRVAYVGPVSYYFLLLTVFVLLLSFLNIDMVEYTAVTTDSLSSSDPQQSASQSAFQKTAFSNFRLISFVMIPWFIVATYLLFYKSKLNIIEMSVFTFYTQAQPMLLSILGLFLFKFFDVKFMSVLVALISFVFYAYASARFFKHNHPVWAFTKGLFTSVIGMIFFAFFAGLVGFIAALIDPEGMKELLNIQQ